MASQVTQVCEFECCYLIDTELNAHRYRIEITVNGPQRQEDYGYVIEFSKLLSYMKEVVPDKRFLFDTSSTNIGRDIAFSMGQRGVAIQALPFALSAESLCNYIATTLQEILNSKEPGVNVVGAKLREDSTSYVSWKPDFSFSTT